MRRRTWLFWILGLAAVACAKPKPPELKPVSVQVSAIRPEGVELLLLLDAYNPNGFPLVVNGVTGVFETQNGVELGRGSAAQAFTIPRESSAPVSAKLDVHWSSLSALTPYVVGRLDLPYRIRGSARIGGEQLNVEVPFTLAGKLTEQQVIQAGMRGMSSLLNQGK